MICLKPIRAMFMVAPLIIPTLALSEPVTIDYFARVELVMHAPENASFECASNDRPAQLEITEDMPAVIGTYIPTSFLALPEPPEPSVRTWRGTELIPERVSRIPTRSTNFDWNITTFGNIDFCVGPATLKVVGGSLNVFANLGQYEASVISSDNVLQDLDIEYAVNVSNMNPFLFNNSDKGDDQPPEIIGQFVGLGTPPVTGRVLGRLDIRANPLTLGFINQSDLDHVTHPTRLNVTLLLVEPSLTSDSPVVVHERNGEADD